MTSRATPAGKLAARLAGQRAVGRAGAYPRAFRIPILDADPDADDPTNLWAFDDGRVRFRGSDGTVHELEPGFGMLTLASAPAASTGINVYHHASSDTLRVRRPDGTWAVYNPSTVSAQTGQTAPGSTTTQNKQADSQPTTKRKTYSASWGRAFNDVRGPEDAGNLYYGRWDSTWGERRIMLGLPDAAIRADLAGASIQKVELHLRNVDSYAFAGIEIYFGGHNQSAKPGSYSSVREQIFHDHWPHSGTGATWRGGSGDITWFGKKLRDNVIKGITVNQPSGSRSYYGQLDWSSFQLRITYSS